MLELPANIQALLSFVLILLGAYAVLFALSLTLWTFRDIRARSRDIFVQILATLLVLIFNVPGLLLYFVLRPKETLEEAYERALGQEALLQDIEERFVCPSCKRKAEADFIVCPHCGTDLRKRCVQCERALRLQWQTCPYCGSAQAEPVPVAVKGV